MPLRVPLKTLITVGRLNFSHLRLAKTLTARQAACVFCKSNLSKIHLAGRRDSFRGAINYLGDIIVCAAINKKLGNIYRDEFCDLLEIIDREQKAMREIPETCIGCVHQKACHGGCKSESHSRYQNYLNRDLLCLLPYTQNEHWPGTSAK